MIGEWMEITIPATVASPLHVGSGETGFSAQIVNDKTGDMVEIARVAHAGNDDPILPGSGLKGAARALMRDDPAEALLFGSRKIREAEDAKAGRLTFWTALRDGTVDLPDLTDAPYADSTLANETGERADNKPDHASAGLFVEARTAIDPKRGIADEGRLFHRQYVAPGVRFTLRLGLFNPDDEARKALAKLLKRMAEGFALGSGTRADQGRMTLDLDAMTTQAYLLTSGELKEDDAPTRLRDLVAATAAPTFAAPVRSVALRLVGDGPFLVNDSSAERKRRAQSTAMGEEGRLGHEDAPNLSALKDFSADLPRLPGASLRGALRSRALWLGRLGEPNYEDRRDEVFKLDNLATMSCSERLFGINGWASLLRLSGIACESHEGWETLTSVKLDSMSMAPVDGGLFGIRASVDPVFTVTLSLEQRGELPDEKDCDFFDRLVSSLKKDGLVLGHAGNRGFGWFRVEEVVK